MTYGQPSASIRLSLATAPWICRRSTPCLPCPGPSWEACAGEGGWMVFLILRWILSMATMRWTLCKDKHPPPSPSCKPSTWLGSSTVKPTSALPLHIYQAQEISAVWAQHKQRHHDKHHQSGLAWMCTEEDPGQSKGDEKAKRDLVKD